MEESYWKRTYEKILIGMGLFGITLNFLFLNQVLPFLGALLLFTGFRKLRLENRWYKAGYAGTALKVVITIVTIVLGSVLEREKIYASYAWKGIAFCGGILPVILMVCLFLGMREELEQEGQWKVIHHFLWNGTPGFRGTEAVQINPAYQELNGGWTAKGKLTGQVLYDKNGTSYTADYTTLQDENYDTGMNAFFYGSQQYASIFAEFSMPHRGENSRGYVAYEIKAKESDWWIDSWINYIHQKSIWQYPVISAAQNRKQGGWLDNRVFSTVQDALQVLPEGESEGSIGS